MYWKQVGLCSEPIDIGPLYYRLGRHGYKNVVLMGEGRKTVCWVVGEEGPAMKLSPVLPMAVLAMTYQPQEDRYVLLHANDRHLHSDFKYQLASLQVEGERVRVGRLGNMEESPRQSRGDVVSLEEGLLQVLQWDGRLVLHSYSLQTHLWTRREHYTDCLLSFMQHSHKVFTFHQQSLLHLEYHSAEEGVFCSRVVVTDLNSLEQSALSLDSLLKETPQLLFYQQELFLLTHNHLVSTKSRRRYQLGVDLLSKVNRLLNLPARRANARLPAFRLGHDLAKVQFNQEGGLVLYLASLPHCLETALAKVRCVPTQNDLVFRFEKAGVDVLCNRHLLQVFSRKFDTLLKNNPVSIIKLSDVDARVFQVLVDQLFYVFSRDLPEDSLIDLLVLSHKFLIQILQHKCERALRLDKHNLGRAVKALEEVPSAFLREKCFSFVLDQHPALISEGLLSPGVQSFLCQTMQARVCGHPCTVKVYADLKDTFQVNVGDRQEVFAKQHQIKGLTYECCINLEICQKCHVVLNTQLDQLLHK